MSGPFFDVCLTVKRKVHESRFERSQEGYEALLAWVRGLGVTHCWFGIEHTGGYERALAEYLLGIGHRVSLLDGLRVRRFKESDGKKAKTDKSDAKAIARFVREKRPALWVPLPDAYAELQQLTRHREDLVSSRTQWLNRLKAPRTSDFVKSQERAMVDALEMMIKSVDEQIVKCIGANPEMERCVERMDSVTGIGVTTAAVFLAEAGPITKETYPSPNKLALAAGLVPLPWQSGVSLRGTYTKPYGNERLRNCLNLPAKTAKKRDDALSLFAKRLEERGKCKAIQNRAVMRKLVNILWAVATSDTDYDPAKAVKNFPSKTT